MQRYDDLNTPLIAFVGLLGTVLTVILILVVQVLYYAATSRGELRKIVNVPTTTSDSLLAEQEVKLTRYGWVSQENKQVAIPIERAMELVVRELSAAESEEGSDDQ
jgi:hypothetical protein